MHRHSFPTPVVVLTGASSGVGCATARAFEERGSRLVLVARDRRTLDIAAAECEERGGAVRVVPIDVTDPDAEASLATAAIKTRRCPIDVCAVPPDLRRLAGVGHGADDAACSRPRRRVDPREVARRVVVSPVDARAARRFLIDVCGVLP
jgi:NAD(P)-dependent dehydrogenase (short-subunit alcohol dehydrogenase family)